MIKLLCLSVFVALLLGCSSASTPNYEVTTYKDMSVKLLGLADRKRQEAHYGDAIELYLEAEKYAIKRNDKFLLGLSQLKRATIAILQGRQTEASLLMREVEQMVKYEQVDLEPAIDFVKAKMAAAAGDNALAKGIYADLEQFYAQKSQQSREKQIYYRFLGWNLDFDAVNQIEIAAGMNELRGLYQSHQLHNIEIFSFALLSYLQWLVHNNDPQTPLVLEEALSHFGSVELSNKIAECYGLGAKFYLSQGDKQKADYYLSQGSKINLVL